MEPDKALESYKGVKMECRFSFYDENEEICKACDEEIREICRIGKEKRLGVNAVSEQKQTDSSKSILSVLKQIIAEGVAGREGSRGIYERLCKEFPDRDKKRLYSLMYAYLSRLGIKVQGKKESKSVYSIVKDSVKKGVTDVNTIHAVLIKEFPDRDKRRLRALIYAYMDRLGVKSAKTEQIKAEKVKDGSSVKTGRSIQSAVKEYLNAGLSYKEIYEKLCSEFQEHDKKRLYNLMYAYASRIKKGGDI